MADWLPGWNRYLFNLRGKPYQFTHNPKGCLHTTEGGSIAGALAAYAPYPPHGIYDWRTRERLQHIPLSLASYSAMDGNDDDYMVQIELVGFAAESRFWPDVAWRNIAEDVLKPIEDHFGVPRRALGFKDARDGISPPLASTSSPIRLNWAQLRDFAGWLGHQHLPAPDEHWDPGAVRIDRAFALMDNSKEALDMPALIKGPGPEIYAVVIDGSGTTLVHLDAAEAEAATKGGATVGDVSQGVVDALRAKGRDHVARATWNYKIPNGSDPTGFSAAHVLPDRIRSAVAAVGTPDVDLTALASLIRQGLQIPTVKDLVDEMDRRARDNNPATGPVS